MPLYLEPRDIVGDLEGFKSVLIVPCYVCPPMSLAMQKKKPFLELLKHGLKTEAFEEYVGAIRDELDERGIRSDVFATRVPLPLMCLWTEGQRRKLRMRAEDYDAVLVVGCNSAAYTAQEALEDTNCEVVQAMRMRAMANATTKFRFPMKVELDLHPLRKMHRARRHRDRATGTSENEEETS